MQHWRLLRVSTGARVSTEATMESSLDGKYQRKAALVLPLLGGHVGESEREQTGGREAGQAKDVCFGSAQDRNRTSSKVRQKKATDLD
jgi:hypothetical protein